MGKTIEQFIFTELCEKSISTETILHYHRPAGKIVEEIKIAGNTPTIMIGIENLLIHTLKQMPKEDREATLDIFTKNVQKELRNTQDEGN